MLDHPKLTARQQQILDLIQMAISRTGAPPTRAEIATELGFKSANAAEEHLQALARKGVIELVSGTSRGIRLRNETVRSINAARGAIERGDISEKVRHIGKAVRILEEGLKGGLNPAQGGDIARNLAALYDYCVGRLTLANVRNDAALVEEVVSLITPVAQSWNDIGTNNGAAAQGAGA